MAGKKGNVWEQFRSGSAVLRRNFGKLTESLNELASGESLGVVRGAALINAEVEEWERAMASGLRTMREVAARLEEEGQTAGEVFDSQLRREITGRGHSIHGDASLLVIDGIVHVDIEADKGMVKVNGMLANALSPALLADEIEREFQQLRKAVTPPEKMVREILEAYEEEIRTAGRNFGAQVETTALLLRLTLRRQTAKFRANPVVGNFREYPRELFRADLFTLIESGNLHVASKAFRYASGSDTVGAVFMMVPALGRTAHVGRVWFEPTGD